MRIRPLLQPLEREPQAQHGALDFPLFVLAQRRGLGDLREQFQRAGDLVFGGMDGQAPPRLGPAIAEAAPLAPRAPLDRHVRRLQPAIVATAAVARASIPASGWRRAPVRPIPQQHQRHTAARRLASNKGRTFMRRRRWSGVAAAASRLAPDGPACILGPRRDPGDTMDFLKRTLSEGFVAGVVGAGGVAAWFLLVDALNGRPFFTPALLGAAVFLGLRDPAQVQIAFATVIMYTMVHVVAVFIVGTIAAARAALVARLPTTLRSEEHTSELQSRGHLVCRLLLEKKNKYK